MLTVIAGEPSDGPVAELGLSQKLMGLAKALGEGECALRLYRPEPTLAFGRRDTRNTGYARAAASASLLGFSPVTRLAGGRAAAYHRHSLIMELAGATSEPHGGARARFHDHAEVMRRALQRLGVDARIGELPGEYCPGEFSVNGRGEVKLVGAAQRIVRGTWLLSAVIQVDDRESLVQVTRDVYDDLGLPWRPQTLGTIADEIGGVVVQEVEVAVIECYREVFGELRSVSWVDQERTRPRGCAASASGPTPRPRVP